MIASDDPELFNWLRNAAAVPHSRFLRPLAEAGLRADSFNYPILRPALLVMKAKYPEYEEWPTRLELSDQREIEIFDFLGYWDLKEGADRE